MKRKVLSVLLAMSMLLSLLPVTAFATDAGSPTVTLSAESETETPPDDSNPIEATDSIHVCGDGLTWKLENGTLSVSGTGAMYDYSWYITEDYLEYLDAPWFAERESIMQIVVEDGVTYIGTNAFADCYNAIDVSIADSVVAIGEGAFEGCGSNWEQPSSMDNTAGFMDNNAGIMPIAEVSDVTRYAVLVLDISGSMGNRPMTAQKAAAIKFCKQIMAADGENYVAIVSFGSSVRIVCDFTNDIDELTSQINTISTSGDTNTNGALKKADELLSALPTGVSKSIVLCSDGLPNTGGSSTDGPFDSSDHSSYRYANAVYNTSTELKAKYDIFTLGFFHSLSGSSLEFAQKFMYSLQNAGYYEVKDPDDLEFTFGDVAGDVTTPGNSGIHITAVGPGEYQIHTVDEAGNNLSKVLVTYDGQQAYTDEWGLVTFPAFTVGNPVITAELAGYTYWSNQHTNWQWSDNMYETIIMYPEELGEYKLMECHYSNFSDMSHSTDLLTQTKKVSLGNQASLTGDLDFGNFYLTCKATAETGVAKYELWQAETMIAETTTTSFGKLSSDKFQEGGNCFIRVVAEDGTKVDTPINLTFKMQEINEATQVSLSNESISFKVGDDVPFVGGTTFAFNLPVNSPLSFSKTSEKLQVGLNLNLAGGKTLDEQITEAKKLISDTKTASKLNYGKLDKHSEEVFKSLLGESNKKFKFFKDGEINLIGYAEGDFGSSTAKGYIMLQAKIKAAEFGFTTWVVVVPITVQVGLGLEGGLKGEISYNWANATLAGGLDLELAAKLTAFGGVGVGKAVGVGAYGSAELEFLARLLGVPQGLQKIDLTGELGIKAYIAFFEYKKPFAYNTWHLYTANNVRSISTDGATMPVMASLYDISSYDFHNLEYLYGESGWMGYPVMTIDVTAGTQLTSLLSDTYRNAQPTMVAGNDGLYAAFLRADAGTGDVYTVVSKYDGNVWSEPVRVDGNAALDSFPSLCVGSDGTIWLAYSQTTGEIAGDSLLDYAKSQQIVVGTIHPDTLAFTQSAVYSSPSAGYTHLHHLTLVNGNPTLVWANSDVADDNSVLWPASSSLYTASYSGGSWSVATVIASVSKPILQLSAGEQNGSLTVAFVQDEDGDYLTTEDQNLYRCVGSSPVLTAQNVQGEVRFGTLPGQSVADFVWNGEGCLQSAGGNVIPAEGITDEYVLVGDRIYYSAVDADGNSAHLTTVIYQNGTWSSSVTLSSGDRYLEDISVSSWNGSDYVLGMNTKATISANSVEDRKDLVWAQVNSTSDLKLDGIHYEADGLMPGAEVPITLDVTNASDHTVTSIDVVRDGQLLSTESCSLAPGGDMDIVVYVTCPSTLVEYTFTVRETAVADFSPEDNAGTVGIGYADLSVDLMEQKIGEQVSLLAYVKNEGVAPASGAIRFTDPAGKSVAMRRFENLENGSVVVMTCPIEAKGDYTASVLPDADDLYGYNNTDSIYVDWPWLLEAPTPDTPDLPYQDYTVTFVDRLTGAVLTLSTVKSGTAIGILPEAPYHFGCFFTGWYKADGTLVTSETVVTGDMTVYAEYWYDPYMSDFGIPSTPAQPSYSITVPESLHGTITANTTAKAGDKVTLTANSDIGYYLDTLVVVDAKGSAVALTENRDGTYTFTMPASNVTVTAVFTLMAYDPDWDSEQEPAPWSNPFADVSASDWYYDAVAYVSENGLMKGISSNMFSPTGVVTRGQIMTILARMDGVNTDGSIPWYQKGVSWAVKNGVSDGTNPEAPVTREQLVTMLWRYAGQPSATAASLNPFSDASDVSTWARDAMAWAVETGIINGANGKLNPQGTASRAEAAAIFMRF